MTPVEVVRPWLGALSVAAVNGPNATVVSGSVELLSGLVAEAQRCGVRAP